MHGVGCWIVDLKPPIEGCLWLDITLDLRKRIPPGEQVHRAPPTVKSVFLPERNTASPRKPLPVLTGHSYVVGI